MPSKISVLKNKSAHISSQISNRWILSLLLLLSLLGCDKDSIYFTLENELLIGTGSLPQYSTPRFILGPTAGGFLYTVSTSKIYRKQHRNPTAIWVPVNSLSVDTTFEIVRSMELFQGQLFVSLLNKNSNQNRMYRLNDVGGESWTSLLSGSTVQGAENSTFYNFDIFAANGKLFVSHIKQIDGDEITFAYHHFYSVDNPMTASGNLTFAENPASSVGVSSIALGDVVKVSSVQYDGSEYWVGGDSVNDIRLFSSPDGSTFTQKTPSGIDLTSERLMGFRIYRETTPPSIKMFITTISIDATKAVLYGSSDTGSTFRALSSSSSLAYTQIAQYDKETLLIGTSGYGSSLLTGGLYYANIAGGSASGWSGVASAENTKFGGGNYLATDITKFGIRAIYVDSSTGESGITSRIYLSIARSGMWSNTISTSGSGGNWKRE